MATGKRTSASRTKPAKQETALPGCGLCGKTGELTTTLCCGRLICDDEDNYVLFSYARNSCHRNHSRYTLCGAHYNEGHDGRWQECAECRDIAEPEMYVYFGTNEYNFEKLENPPAYEPTTCRRCARVISLSEDGYVMNGEGYLCLACSAAEFARVSPKSPSSRSSKKR